MTFEEYQFATPFYALSVALRDRILRAPLGLVFKEEDLSKEWKDIHLGAFDESSRLSACMVLTPIDNNIIKMRQVAVHELVQGKGIGTSLVKFAEEVIRKKGYTAIVLNARIPAVVFYERLDYSKIGEEFVEVGISHQKMKKNLSS